MITLQNLSLSLGGHSLLEEVGLSIFAGQKLGVIGRNGAGKTSLFKLLMGELSHDAGKLDMPSNLHKAQMQQEVIASERSAVAYVIDGDTAFRELETKLHKAEQAEEHHKLGELHAALELMDGYTVQNRAEQLLSGLGFSKDDFQRTIKEFSGGWRIRLNLARALMMPSDLLLLDEPTNHLDLETSLWLQQWLQRYQGTLLLISHDRMFIDQVVGHIVSFEDKKLFLYRGNYSAYETQKAERLAQQQAAFEKQQQRRKQVEDFVRRFGAKATKARQAQSRLKELDRMIDIAPAHIDSPFVFGFREADKMPDSLMTCDQLEIGYEHPLLKPFTLNLGSDARLGLLGVNGQGKSTLLKALSGQLAPLSGEIHRHDYLRVGYMAQHQVDALDTNASPLQLILRLDQDGTEQEVRNFLGGFDFRGDRIHESIHHFSGGEKSRLALALIVWQKPNLLLLDEPTNHLDLEMRHALTLALQDYRGAMIVVSHDRHLLSNTVDQFLLVRNSKLEFFEGDLADYENGLFENSAGHVSLSGEGSLDRKRQRQEAAQHRQQMKPLRDKIKSLEKQMEGLQKELKKIGATLTDTDLYHARNKEELSRLLKEQGQLNSRLENVESEWLQAQEELESFAE